MQQANKIHAFFSTPKNSLDCLVWSFLPRHTIRLAPPLSKTYTCLEFVKLKHYSEISLRSKRLCFSHLRFPSPHGRVRFITVWGRLPTNHHCPDRGQWPHICIDPDCFGTIGDGYSSPKQEQESGSRGQDPSLPLLCSFMFLLFVRCGRTVSCSRYHRQLLSLRVWLLVASDPAVSVFYVLYLPLDRSPGHTLPAAQGGFSWLSL